MTTNKKIPLKTNLHYLFQFSKIWVKEKFHPLKMLQERFIAYRDENLDALETLKEETKTVKSSSAIQIRSKQSNLNYPLLVLFDAENMPIQENFKLIKEVILKEFGLKSWNNATLEAAYKESTEYYNNKGYNQAIKTHYVGYGKDKADDKLIEIAQTSKIPHVIIVSNDKGLIERLQDITSKSTAGKLFVYNGDFLGEYTRSNDEVKALKITELKAKQVSLIKELDFVKVELSKLENRPQPIILKKAPSILVTKKVSSEVISENLRNANLDKNIKNELIKNPLFINFSEQLAQVDALTEKEAKKQAQKVLELFEKLPTSGNLLKSKGLEISVFKIALRYAINNFELENYNKASLVEFVQFVIKDSNIKLVLKKPSQYKLFLKDTPINELEMSEVEPDSNDYDVKEGVLEKNFSASINQDFFREWKEKVG